MPRLDELNLTADATPEVDWDAPEAGTTPPSVGPGDYEFLFKLDENPDNWFDKQMVEVVKGQPKRAFLVMCYTPIVLSNAAGQPLQHEDGTPIQLPRQRATFFKNEKMLISQGAELLRALGIRISGGMDPAAISAAIKEVDGRVRFGGSLGWRTFFNTTNTTISTFPRKKRGELAWPRNADNSYVDVATDPATNQKAYGYPEIYRVKAPKVEATPSA